ncbi:LysR family transcriptional regulator, partial [Ralstonia solanacearum]|uniref:LysR family transcriptional regulator n=1 Tax=Ralstonia solanacearum TaxID=305 RepID=UPI002E1DC6F1
MPTASGCPVALPPDGQLPNTSCANRARMTANPTISAIAHNSPPTCAASTLRGGSGSARDPGSCRVMTTLPVAAQRDAEPYSRHPAHSRTQTAPTAGCGSASSPSCPRRRRSRQGSSCRPRGRLGGTALTQLRSQRHETAAPGHAECPARRAIRVVERHPVERGRRALARNNASKRHRKSPRKITCPSLLHIVHLQNITYSISVIQFKNDSPVTVLDIEAVQAFVLTADLKSFTRAAEAMDTTQSAVSLKIKRLEDRLGRRLLERTPRVVRLSPDGDAFLAAARELIAAHQGALGAFGTKPHRLSVGISHHIVGAELPWLLRQMVRAEPATLLEIRVASSRETLDAFDRDELDAAV